MKTRCTEVTNHDHQWEVYLRCAFFVFLYYLIWMPKIWCFFWFRFGQVSMGALSSLTHESDLCRLLLCPRFSFLEFVGQSQYTWVHLSANPRLLSYCWKTATTTTKKNQSEKKKTVVMTSLLWLFAPCVSLPLCTVTFCVPVRSHVFEHHLYVALYLCNSCSCDHDGFVVFGLTLLECNAKDKEN